MRVGSCTATSVQASGGLPPSPRASRHAHGFTVAPGRIGHRATFVHAMTAGQGVQEFEPNGKAAREIARLHEWTCQHARQPDLLQEEIDDAEERRSTRRRLEEGHGRADHPPSRRSRKSITVYLDAAAHRQLHLLALEQDSSAQQMVADAINGLFQKHGKPRIAGGLPGYSKQPSHERLLAHRNHRFKPRLIPTALPAPQQPRDVVEHHSPMRPRRPREHFPRLDTTLPAASLAHRDKPPRPFRVVPQRQHHRKSSSSGMRP